MRKDDHLIFEALLNKLPGAGPDAALINTGAGENAEHAQQFTVVSGGVDNTSEDGIDINPADHIHAHSLKHAAEETLGEMQGDEDFDDTFPEEYREYVKDIFMMSNDSGDFIAILPGHLNEDQIFNKLVDVRDNSSENAENADARKERTQRKWQMNKDRWAKWKMENPEAAAKHAAKKMGKSENAESYSAMTHLTQAANEIRDILQSHADDEARTEHIIKMAQLILGSKADYTDAEYRKMLDGLIVILNRFIIVPMN
jgi:hypothetical protein